MQRFDVFISHASEDKAEVARPLATLLIRAGLRVWLDEFELRLGDSLRRKIDEGLGNSKFGVVVLSPSFFSKEWPQKELDALVSREQGYGKVILPVWHNIESNDIGKFSPLLADRLATKTKSGLAAVANEILKAVGSVNAPEKSEELRSDVPDLSTYLIRFLDHIQYVADAGSNVTGIPTGLYDLDRMLGGLQPGELYVVAARPSVGTTTLALTVASHVAVQELLPVVYFSLHNRGQEVMNRLIASVGRIDRSRLAAGFLTDEEWPRLTEAVEKLRDVALFIDESTELDIETLLARAEGKSSDLKLGLVVIDKFELLRRDFDEKKQVIARIAAWARRSGTPVLLTMTAAPTAEQRVDKRPMLSDLESSEQIRMHAAATVLLYRDELYHRDSIEAGVVEAIVAHQRDGPTGTVKLIYLRDIGRLESAALE